jgi:poly-gamma-glutamate synthesis protein (capsule biosynthesis protein)
MMRAAGLIVFGALLISACSAEPGGQPVFLPPAAPTDNQVVPHPESTPTPFQPVPGTSFPAPTGAPEQGPDPGQPLTIWSPGIGPLSLPPFLTETEDRDRADLQLLPGNGPPITTQVYALAAPFPTLEDAFNLEELLTIWEGGGGKTLLLARPTLQVLRAAWGPPDDNVQVLPADQLLDAAWDQPNTLAILPFDQLEPRWKVMSLDGQSPIRNDFDPDSYPLAVPISLDGPELLVEAVLAQYGPGSKQPLLPPNNRDASQLTVVALTGVTALVRATAWTMEQQGLRYPAQDILSWLQQPDILHISNEVPFARDCPYPNPVQANVVFCSDQRYLDLLEWIGTDVVELTGDHFHDWGSEAMLYTLDLYDELGWSYYGGGENLAAGREAVFLEHNGNPIAFIGCNGKGGSFAQASAARPGSVSCDFNWMEEEIRRLSGEGYLVIATFQHFEYYTYAAPAGMQSDFRRLADAGAVVSGSQAHHPHGFEFRGNGFLHYGLGNLFFDQLGISPGTAQGFIDHHVFYAGRHISTELKTLVFVDFARSRPMLPAERRALLQAVFTASGW